MTDARKLKWWLVGMAVAWFLGARGLAGAQEQEPAQASPPANTTAAGAVDQAVAAKDAAPAVAATGDAASLVSAASAAPAAANSAHSVGPYVLTSAIADLEKDNKRLKEQRQAQDQKERDLLQQIAGLQKDKNAALAQSKGIPALEKENAQLKDEVNGLVKREKELMRRMPALEKENKELKGAAGVSADKISAAAEQLSALKKAYQSLAKEHAILASMSEAFSGRLRVPAPAGADEQNFKKIVASNLAFAYGSQGKTGEAIRECRKALALDPANKDIHYNLGYLLVKQKKYQEAVQEYGKALKGTDQDAEIYANLALIYATGLKDQKTAQEYFRKFMAVPPKNASSAGSL